MVILEMREAAYNKAFDLFDDLKELDKKKRMILCELEDSIYECYEASKEGKEEYEDKDDESDIEFRRHNDMRRNMRHYDEAEDDDYREYGHRRSSGMRMRRNRMGRYSY